MAKKIRFPLIMDRDAEARNLEELRTNFSLRAVLEYYENGKLLTWLENLYLLDEADQIRELDKEALDFQRRLCGIFQVEYTRDMDPKVIEQRKKRLERLRAVTDEDQFYRMIDYVAFDQEELADLLDEEETTICLCREEGKDFTFTIPASCKGVSYIGIPAHSGQKPRVRISGGTVDDIENLGITVTSCDMEEPMLLSHKSAEGYSGADIEGVVRESVEMAFTDGKDSLTTEDICHVMVGTQSLSEIMKDSIKKMQVEYQNRKLKKASRSK